MSEKKVTEAERVAHIEGITKEFGELIGKEKAGDLSPETRHDITAKVDEIGDIAASQYLDKLVSHKNGDMIAGRVLAAYDNGNWWLDKTAGALINCAVAATLLVGGTYLMKRFSSDTQEEETNPFTETTAPGRTATPRPAPRGKDNLQPMMQ